MNYSIPVTKLVITKKHLEFIKEDLDNVLTQQIIISQLGNGITYEDTENMDEYERVFIFKKLIQMKKDENEAKQKAIEKAKQGR
jgi:hypothetical protein